MLPGGNWMRSTQNISIHDGILTADVRDERGNWKHSEIKIAPGFTLINNNGVLEQGPLENINETPLLPQGNWVNSAKNINVNNNNLLTAEL